MANFKNYSLEYQKQYENDEFERTLIRIRRSNVLKRIKYFKHEHILEIGCGLEPIFLNFDDYKKLTVVEPVDEFAENARSLNAHKKSIAILKGRIEDVWQELAAQHFDFIIMSSLLHEVPDPGELLESVKQLCADSTIFYLDVPNKRSFHRLLGVETGIIQKLDDNSEIDNRFERQSHFDKASLTGLLKNNGFDILNAYTFFIKPFSSRQMELILDENIIDDSVINGLEKMTEYLPDLGSSLAVEARRSTGLGEDKSSNFQ